MYKKHPVSKGIFTIWIGAGFCPSTVLSFPEKNSYIIKRPESRWVFRLQNDWTIPYKIYKLEDDQHDDLCICRYFTGETLIGEMTSHGTKKYSRDFRVFVYKSGRNRSPLSFLTAHTPYPSKTMARPDTISKLHLFAATCKESYLKPSQTLKCFKLWCWVSSSFLIHPPFIFEDQNLHLKNPFIFVAVICGHCMATYCGTMCPSLQAPDERWNFRKKFQQKYRLIANPENPVLRIESLARTSRHTRLLDEYQNRIQVWTLYTNTWFIKSGLERNKCL